MAILYINNEYCKSLAQLRGYFNLTLNPQDEVYLDLLDNGREHVIAEWLQELGETDFAVQLENIDSDLSDSEYFGKMSAIILERDDIEVPEKTKFSQCFTLESINQDEDAQGKQIIVKLKVLLSVNETYELRVQTSWGTKAINVNPFEVAEGDYIKVNFHFRKRPGKDFEVVGLFADGEEQTIQAVKAKNQSITSDDDFVDLGLSVKWAKCNLGANSPEEYGNYYAWGETEPKSEYTKNSTTYGTKMSCIGGNPEYDAATAALGKGVRLPTIKEIKELIDKCSTERTTQNGVSGRLVIGPNGNSIFLPAAGVRYGTSLDFAGKDGYYWSSTPYEDYDSSAYYLLFCSGNFDWDYDWLLSRGRSVRPVREIKA